LIHILFHAGTFGTTIEYCLRRFSSELRLDIDVPVREDGSMHDYKKEFHPTTIEELRQIPYSNATITSPVYPCKDANVVDTLSIFKQVISQDDKVIFIVLRNNVDYANVMILLWYKLFFCKLSEFLDEKEAYKNWNENYTSINDMMPWEFREFLSLIHQRYRYEITGAVSKAEKNWLVIEVEDILSNFIPTLKRMLLYLNLTLINTKQLDNFYDSWITSQQKIIQEQKMVYTVLDKMSKGEYHEWDKISIMSESLIQFELTNLGFDLKIYGVNEFPTNTNDLRSLIA